MALTAAAAAASAVVEYGGPLGLPAGALVAPGFLALLPTGELVVSDTRREVVVVVARSGAVVRTVGAPGRSAGQLSSPFGVAVLLHGDGASSLLVGENGTARVQQLSLPGGAHERYAKVPSLQSATCVLVAASRVFVADPAGQSVRILRQATLATESVLGASALPNGRPFHPHGLAANNGKLFVADGVNGCVWVFALRSKRERPVYFDRIEGHGLAHPRSVLALRPPGSHPLLLVVESNRLLLLSIDGRSSLQTITPPGSESLELMGAAADADHIFVTHRGANQPGQHCGVLVFRWQATSAGGGLELRRRLGEAAADRGGRRLGDGAAAEQEGARSKAGGGSTLGQSLGQWLAASSFGASLRAGRRRQTRDWGVGGILRGGHPTGGHATGGIPRGASHGGHPTGGIPQWLSPWTRCLPVPDGLGCPLPAGATPPRDVAQAALSSLWRASKSNRTKSAAKALRLLSRGKGKQQRADERGVPRGADLGG